MLYSFPKILTSAEKSQKHTIKLESRFITPKNIDDPMNII